MTSTLVKSVVFTVVTVLATAVLAGVIRNSAGGTGVGYNAIFADATSLNVGDDVRMAGVKVGSVDSIEIADNRLAEVSFTVGTDVSIERGTTAEMQFRNLVGQRYISLEPPEEPGVALEAGHTFTLDETEPALDLTTLFNGFRPLFRMLDPEEVNDLSAQVIAVFQGEGATVENLIANTASLTSTLAEKDQVIGELISSLNVVLDTVNDRSDQLDTTIVTLQRLVSGLAEDRETIGSTLTGLGNLTESVSGLLEEGRPPLKRSISQLDRLSGNLADSEQVLDRFFDRLPTKLDRIGRLGSYGSWLNFYMCSIEGRIPAPEGYYGDVGVQPVAGRCQ